MSRHIQRDNGCDPDDLPKSYQKEFWASCCNHAGLSSTLKAVAQTCSIMCHQTHFSLSYILLGLPAIKYKCCICMRPPVRHIAHSFQHASSVSLLQSNMDI
eukprot:scaffold261389_cov21-Prasinocladus_malaysianus.AAC.1